MNKMTYCLHFLTLDGIVKTISGYMNRYINQ